MLSLVFDAVGVAVFTFTISHFSAGQALKTICNFLTLNQTRIQPKIVSLYNRRIRMRENCQILTTFKFEFCHIPKKHS